MVAKIANLTENTKFFLFFITFAAMKLSVIIPVFNTEDTLARCLDSVIGQQIAGMEIVLVDDGSTDNSPNICSIYAKEHANISLLHQPNKGLSEARNAGLRIARGDYVTFVDSDDDLPPGTYRALMAKLTARPDIDFLEYPVERRGGTTPFRLQLTDRVYTDWQTYWLKTQAYTHAYAWNKIFRKALFEQEMFKPGIVFEDLELMSRLLFRCHCIVTTAQGCYHYRFNPHGLTASAGALQMETMLRSHREIMKRCCDSDYFGHVLNIQLDVYRLGGPLLLAEGMPYKGGLKPTLYRLFGLKSLCIVHKWFWKIRRIWASKGCKVCASAQRGTRESVSE